MERKNKKNKKNETTLTHSVGQGGGGKRGAPHLSGLYLVGRCFFGMFGHSFWPDLQVGQFSFSRGGVVGVDLVRQITFVVFHVGEIQFKP